MQERNLARKLFRERHGSGLDWRSAPVWQAQLLCKTELTKAQMRRKRGIWIQRLRERGFAGSGEDDEEEYEVLYEASRRMQDDMWQEYVDEVRQEWRSRKRIWREVNFRAYMLIRQACDSGYWTRGDVDLACE